MDVVSIERNTSISKHKGLSGSLKKRGYTLSETLAGYLYLTPVFLWVLIFMLFPMGYVIYLSFYKWNFVSSEKHFVGLGNYVSLLHDPEFLGSLNHTFEFTVVSVLVTIVMSLIIALLLNQQIKGIGILRSIFYSPVVVSMIAAAMVWSFLYDPQYGSINNILHIMGISGPHWLDDPHWALISIVIMTVWKNMGYYAVIYLAALQGISNSYYEAAALDGANRWKVFRFITWPLLMPATLLIAVMGIINSFQVFGQIYVMTQGGPVGSTNVIVYYLYEKAFQFFEMGYASAVGFVLFIIIFVITLVQFKYVDRKMDF
ncbi:sugar ABC transporter permease [Fodinisporobacter ferrooxydans]|uniref:Sugar ABC transporter permease n=1 Tax=Fodinisporobacter ferrooxydans TaxID=2901836 RepID=A0ABY4CH65_9BACL|nr:sugar ABC transporter permease [Alicyclobacillaceae bacterium MYW30-H2]